jgi:hypothetical protein
MVLMGADLKLAKIAFYKTGLLKHSSPTMPSDAIGKLISK